MFWFFLKYSLISLILIIFVLLSVAFYTVLERHILGHSQRRQGPMIVGFFGILQAFTDAFKLIVKETVFPKNANYIIFFFAPIFTLGLAFSIWAVIPFGNGWAFVDFNLGILYILALSSLSVHSVIMAGWSSNSKYAFLGALRSAAQMISYEIPLGVCILCVTFLTRSLNINEIIMAQYNVWYFSILFPIFLVFLICMLAETNRHPFDLPEAEAELVSGYNVEYSAAGFALFFIAEYSNIIMMSALGAILFMGGWHLPFYVNDIIGSLVLPFKTLLFMFFFVLIRTTLPRYRYDQLMRLGWKIFLPITLMFLVILAISISLNNI